MEHAELLEKDARTSKLEKLDRLMRQVEDRRCGRGDFTKEKQERSAEQSEALYRRFKAWRDASARPPVAE